jgi:M6 family metalloprotease-like protein
MFRPAAILLARRRFPILIGVFVFLVSGATHRIFAAQTDDTPEQLTDSLIKLHGQHAKAAQWEQSSIVTKMQTVALSRRQALLARIASNPGAVLKAALPDAVSRRFPATVRNLIEHGTELDGELEIIHEDRPRRSRFHYTLRSLGLNYTLHFRREPPSHLKTGARVRVRGIRVADAIALESSAENVVTLATAPPNTFGDQRTLIILVNFSDAPAQPYTPAYAEDLVFNTVSNFFLENSYQQAFLSGDVKGWYTINMNRPVSNCDYHQIAAKADAAALAAGANLSSYSRKVYAFPQADGCGWWGVGTVGGNPSRAWINGDLKLRVVAHELGHNLGLYHSHSLDCGSVVVGKVCTIGEYGDSMDTMGAASFHFNAFQKERLGWLDYNLSPPITLAESAGSYSVHPFETVGNQPKALKILRSINPSSGRRSYFYLECRRPLGFDAGVANYPSVLGGFLLHLGEENSGNSSYLLDMTPQTSSWNDPALAIGRSFTDPVAGLTVTPSVPCSDSLSGNIAVALGPGACARSAPDSSLGATPSQWTVSGKSLSYVMTVVNHDSNCTAANFTLAPIVPQGWTATLSNPVLTINSGTNKSTTITITPPANIMDGTYNFDVTATHDADPALTDTTSGAIAVVSSLAVNASIDAPVFSVPGIAIATVQVDLSGVPVTKARVRLTITRPDGKIRNVNVRTDPNGIARFKYRLTKRFPPGTYQVSATASSRGLDGSTNASFLLQ